MTDKVAISLKKLIVFVGSVVVELKIVTDKVALSLKKFTVVVGLSLSIAEKGSSCLSVVVVIKKL